MKSPDALLRRRNPKSSDRHCIRSSRRIEEWLVDRKRIPGDWRKRLSGVRAKISVAFASILKDVDPYFHTLDAEGCYGAFLLVCYEADNEEFQTICKIGNCLIDYNVYSGCPFSLYCASCIFLLYILCQSLSSPHSLFEAEIEMEKHKSLWSCRCRSTSRFLVLSLTLSFSLLLLSYLFSWAMQASPFIHQQEAYFLLSTSSSSSLITLKLNPLNFPSFTDLPTTHTFNNTYSLSNS